MTEEYVVYTLINTDLKMSNGKIVSQSQHAIQKMLQSLSKHSTCYTKWKNNNFAKVCLKSSQSTIETIFPLDILRSVFIKVYTTYSSVIFIISLIIFIFKLYMLYN